jgi:hypothetical protein
MQMVSKGQSPGKSKSKYVVKCNSVFTHCPFFVRLVFDLPAVSKMVKNLQIYKSQVFGSV